MNPPVTDQQNLLLFAVLKQIFIPTLFVTQCTFCFVFSRGEQQQRDVAADHADASHDAIPSPHLHRHEGPQEGTGRELHGRVPTPPRTHTPTPPASTAPSADAPASPPTHGLQVSHFHTQYVNYYQ